MPPPRITALVSAKGGVGKSVSAANIATAWAAAGRRVLVVDLDPQGAIAPMFGIARRPGTPAALVDPGELTRQTVRDGRTGVDLLPTTGKLAGLVEGLRGAGWQRRLASTIAASGEYYDEVLIDTQPGLGRLVFLALAAAHRVLIPSHLETWTIETVGELIGTIGAVRATPPPDRPDESPLNPTLEITGILLTAVRGNRQVERANLVELIERGQVEILTPPIPDREVIRKAVAFGVPAVAHAPRSDAAEAYRELAGSLLGLSAGA